MDYEFIVQPFDSAPGMDDWIDTSIEAARINMQSGELVPVMLALVERDGQHAQVIVPLIDAFSCRAAKEDFAMSAPSMLNALGARALLIIAEASARIVNADTGSVEECDIVLVQYEQRFGRSWTRQYRINRVGDSVEMATEPEFELAADRGLLTNLFVSSPEALA